MTQASNPRFKKQRIKTARGRTASSTKWLQRHVNDRYVLMAKQQNYRSRAAFKLIAIDDKFKILSRAKTIVDLGAAPGSWLQVAHRRASKACIIGIDLQKIDIMSGVHLLQGDFCDPVNQAKIQDLAGGKIDVILSDMAASACGDRQIDHLRIMELVGVALNFAIENLGAGGTFVAKILRGGEENQLLQTIRQHFAKTQFYKPDASYTDSAESFIVATGFIPDTK